MMAKRASSLAGLPRRHAFVCAAIAALLLLGAMAPSALPAANLGAVVSYQKTAHGIAGRTATAEFSVDVYSPQIIRVRVTPQDTSATCRLRADYRRAARLLAVQRGQPPTPSSC